jgi:hypothetical protein
MSGKQYGTIGMVGVGAFVLTLVALHFLDPDLSVVDGYISEYALGDYGWLSRIGNIAAGLGTVAIALGLRSTLASGKRVTASWVLILIGGLGWIVSGFFATDPTGATDTTTAGAVHDLAGYVQLLSLVAASWVLRGVFSRDDRYKHLARTQLWFAVLISVALVAMILLFEVSVGLPQRVFVVVMLSWLFFLAANVWREETPPIAR